MPAYTVQAEVVDISTDTPKAADAFWVDTNVWYWMSYTRASHRRADRQPKHYQKKLYPAYLKKAMSVRSKFFWHGLGLSELARQIEDGEREIAESLGHVPVGISAKDFRHGHPALRAQVVKEVRSCCDVIKYVAKPLRPAFKANCASLKTAMSDMGTCALDAYDLFALQSLREARITHVLTDDGDFCTVSGITLFTANRGVIEAARAQGKLKIR
jgi:hypothetical protein